MSSQKVGKFINRNLVAIIVVPTIIGLHWICEKIQNNEKFVRADERKELPIVRAARLTSEEILNTLRGRSTPADEEKDN